MASAATFARSHAGCSRSCHAVNAGVVAGTVIARFPSEDVVRADIRELYGAHSVLFEQKMREYRRETQDYCAEAGGVS